MKILAMLLIGISFLFAAVDINNASKDELMSLKGIGSKKAEAIIRYRKEHCFKSLTALSEVKGIGEKFLLKNKENITVGTCKK